MSKEQSRYIQAVNRLLSLADFERKSRANQPPDWHLRRVERLMEMLDQPHLAKPVIHVAGSKGKGSTAAMIASALSANGYKTGLYTSPHLHKFTERIMIDGKPIPKDDFSHLIDSLWHCVEKIGQTGDMGVVSVFEMLTAMAFIHFRDYANTDFSVIEVGLGGRLDATNVVSPEVAVITPISLDHVPILGDTVPQIAKEKAGIIKSGKPAVIGRLTPDARLVVDSVGIEKASEIVDAIDAVHLISIDEPRCLNEAQSFNLQSKMGTMNIKTRLLGQHQIDNARTAVATLQTLGSAGYEINAKSTAHGISNTKWQCRAEVIKIDSRISALLDGAHNDASAQALIHTVKQYTSDHNKVGLVIGGTSGHDATVVAHESATLKPEFVIITQSRHPKSLDAEELAEVWRLEGVMVKDVIPDVSTAIDAAARLANDQNIDLIVVCGSLFVAAEAREQLMNIKPELYDELEAPFINPYASA